MTTVDYCQKTDQLLGGKPPTGFHYRNRYSFILANAKSMPDPVLSRSPGQLKQCFMNATLAALRQPRKGHEQVYCEGYAVSANLPEFPMEHAWVLEPTGDGWHVVDVTWETPGLEYFGLAFSRQYLLETMKQRKYYGLIDAWETGWPLMRLAPEKLAKACLHPLMKTL